MDRILATAALFRGIDPRIVSGLAGRLNPVSFAPGQVIYAGGDIGAELFIITAGKVKMGCRADDGRENILTVLAPPDMFGELSIIDPGPQPWTATAITEVSAVSIDRTQLHDFMAECPEISDRLLRLLARRLRRITNTLADLTFIDAPARLAKQLLGLAQRFGIRENGSMRVTHDLTQEELAQLVGATRETVNKALSEFSSRGWIRLDGKSVLISDSERLARRAR
jgi:CRP/FNR family transcriptional regulator, cyclic AMP receptor protein